MLRLMASNEPSFATRTWNSTFVSLRLDYSNLRLGNVEKSVNRKHVMLREFHKKFGHTVNHLPTEISEIDRVLRAKLIFTEALELCRALGVHIYAPDGETLTLAEDADFDFEAVLDQGIDWIEAADGIADLQYVVIGTEVSLGLDCDFVFDEVHRSNMSKGTEKDEHGKTLKTNRDYSPPDVSGILKQQYPKQMHLFEPPKI